MDKLPKKANKICTVVHSKNAGLF